MWCKIQRSIIITNFKSGYFLAIGVLIISRLIIQLLLYHSGFIALTADEFGRTVLAAEWARNPNLQWSGNWLPFYDYLFGSALHLWWNLLIVPRILIILFGLSSIVLMFVFSTLLFEDARIGLVSSILLAINPAHIWLSSTPLSEMVSFTIMLGSLILFLLFLRNSNWRALFMSSSLLAIANGFRYEVWMVSIAFSLYLIFLIVRLLRRRQVEQRMILRLFSGAVIPWIFPLMWIVGNYIYTGNPLFFISATTSYKITWYGPGSSFLPYITTAIKIDPLFVFLIVVGFIAVLTYKKRKPEENWYIWITFVPFFIFFLSHGSQPEPEGNWIRYLAPFLFMTYPLIAATILLIARQFINPIQLRSAVIVVLLACLAFVQLHTAFNFTNDPAAEGLMVGLQLKDLRQNNHLSSQKPVIIELEYWQYLAIQVGLNDITTVLYDRPLDIAHRNSVSLITSNPELLQTCINYYDVAYIAVRSPDLKAAIEKEFSFPIASNINGYNIYNVTDNRSAHINTASNKCPLVFGQK
jgi:hypothetical protein